MKLLLSAYACEPRKGSEREVGWQWATALARLNHEVWVLTRAKSRPAIEEELAKMPAIPNLHFFYYDLAPLGWLVRGSNSERLYYLLWQWGAYRFAKRVHARERFDQVHHVTMVGVRIPSFMGNLGIPFVFGPVAGGGRAPWRLRWGFGFRGWMMDALRDLHNISVKFDPLMRQTVRKAQRICVTDQQTLALLPARYQSKARIQFGIGWDPNSGRQAVAKPDQRNLSRKVFCVLYVGRFTYLKGGHLAMPAFANLLKAQVSARLTLVGKGPDESRWRKLAESLGIAEHIDWVPWMSRDKLSDLYGQHDVFFFPSLRDSGGQVVLEAMAHGLPVECLDLGGPGTIVNDSCGRVIETASRSRAQVVRCLSDALEELATDSRLSQQLSQGALRRVQDCDFANIVGRIWRETISVEARNTKQAPAFFNRPP